MHQPTANAQQPPMQVVKRPRSPACKACGAAAVRPLARPGRTIRYRNLAVLVIPADIRIPTCTRCDALQIDFGQSSFASTLFEQYRAELRARVRLAIIALSQHISQRRLECLLGRSQGYLSRLRAGAGNPSPELVSHLALLAKDPRARLQELEQYWSESTK